MRQAITAAAALMRRVLTWPRRRVAKLNAELDAAIAGEGDHRPVTRTYGFVGSMGYADDPAARIPGYRGDWTPREHFPDQDDLDAYQRGTAALEDVLGGPAPAPQPGQNPPSGQAAPSGTVPASAGPPSTHPDLDAIWDLPHAEFSRCMAAERAALARDVERIAAQFHRLPRVFP